LQLRDVSPAHQINALIACRFISSHTTLLHLTHRQTAVRLFRQAL
jgi:hypothetical protein